MNIQTILLFIILFISNVLLWALLILQEKWSTCVDEELEALHYKQKLKLNAEYGKMITDIKYYNDTDSVKEGEDNNG